jgi:hypothetical protein
MIGKGGKVREAIGMRAILPILMLASICLLSTSSIAGSGSADKGVLILKVDKDLQIGSQFFVECFFYESPLNNLTGYYVSSQRVPKNFPLDVRLTCPDRKLSADDPTKIHIKKCESGPIKKWEITPRGKGESLLVLEYQVKGSDVKKLVSRPIPMDD